MNFPKEQFVPIFILGLMLLYSYYYFSQKNPGIIENLWGTIKGRLREFYIYSILVCFVFFFFIFIYLNTYNKFNQIEIDTIIISLYGIVLTSILWMPLSIIYYKKPDNLLRFTIIVLLLLVGLFAFNLFYTLYNIKDDSLLKRVSMIGSFYFFIQAFFMDFLYWNYAFLFRYSP